MSASLHIGSHLPRHPAFSQGGQELVNELQRRCRVREYRLGEAVFTAGDEGEAAYLVVSGRVRIALRQAGGAFSLGTFGPGALVGAHSGPAGWKRVTTCRAAEDSELLVVPRADFEAWLADHPHLAGYFDKSVEELCLLETLGLTQLLAPVPSAQIVPTLDAFDHFSVAAGEVVVREGEPGDRLFAVLSGRLEARRKFAADENRLCEILPGHYFGERALLLDAPRAATVTAVEDSTCFTLDRVGFERLTRIAPALPAQLRARFHAYEEVCAEISRAEDVVYLPLRRETALEMIDSMGPQCVPLPHRSLTGVLRMTEFLRGLPPAALPAVLAASRELHYAPGERVDGDGPAVIRHGRVRVSSDGATLARLGPGDWLGVCRSLGEPDPRKCVAEESTECLVLDEDALSKLRQRVPGWDAHLEKLAGVERTRGDRTPADESEPSGTTSLEIFPEVDPGPAAVCRRARRVVWIGQRSPNECGVAALAMVARSRDWCVRYETLRQSFDLLPCGTSLLKLRQMAERLGCVAEVTDRRLDELFDEDLPAIALWHGFHYVVVFRIGRRSVTVGDPAVGIVRMPRRDFHAACPGPFLLLSGSPANLTLTPEMQP